MGSTNAVVPRHEVTAAWLDRHLSDRLGSRVSDVEVARIGEGYGLASHVLRVGWSGPAGAAGHLVAKLWSTDEVGGRGR